MSWSRSDPEPLQRGGFTIINDAVFERFQALIHREAGIWLAPHKNSMLAGRLAKRIRELGLPSYREYLELVENNELERTHMLDRISTNETHFFREPRHFEFLEQKIYPTWQSAGRVGDTERQIRIWSAGCATGEEPYSIAMSLLRVFPPRAGWKVEILATDLSTRALEQARTAIWPICKSQEIPTPYLKEFMLRGTESEAGKMKAGPEIRSVVKFMRLNLNDEAYPNMGPFELIFCRNVLIYFDSPTKDRVIQKLLAQLAPWGLFFLGHSESLGTKYPSLRVVLPTVYRWAQKDKDRR